MAINISARQMSIRGILTDSTALRFANSQIEQEAKQAIGEWYFTLILNLPMAMVRQTIVVTIITSVITRFFQLSV